MYKKFSDYCESKSQVTIYQKLDEVCLSIANSTKPFNEFWTHEGLPVMLESEQKDQIEILNELLDRLGKYAGQFGGNILGNAIQGAKNFGTGFSQGYKNQMGQPQTQAPPGAPGAPPGAPQAAPQIPPKVPQEIIQPQVVQPQPLDANNPKDKALMDRAKTIVDPIKQEFGRAIQDFKGNIQRMALKSPDQHHQWQTANLLANSVEKWLKGWNPQVNRAEQSGPTYRKDYQTAFDQSNPKPTTAQLAQQQFPAGAYMNRQ